MGMCTTSFSALPTALVILVLFAPSDVSHFWRSLFSSQTNFRAMNRLWKELPDHEKEPWKQTSAEIRAKMDDYVLQQLEDLLDRHLRDYRNHHNQHVVDDQYVEEGERQELGDEEEGEVDEELVDDHLIIDLCDDEDAEDVDVVVEDDEFLTVTEDFLTPGRPEREAFLVFARPHFDRLMRYCHRDSENVSAARRSSPLFIS